MSRVGTTIQLGFGTEYRRLPGGSTPVDSNQEPSTVFIVPMPEKVRSKLTIEIILWNILSGMIFTYWIIRLFG